ncbi:ribosomal protein S10 domain-containing protein [Cristinia sonorae]|uniref:Ribosomal protein S10 domain-containing protein n=1 Tax=Cristinia sonorae TaxID=1940300 RepID=A0A8K0UVJ9_9AGAR|nr:ribosomal protein S10 domain-containing protein [Cristinia sonorae]
MYGLCATTLTRPCRSVFTFVSRTRISTRLQSTTVAGSDRGIGSSGSGGKDNKKSSKPPSSSSSKDTAAQTSRKQKPKPKHSSASSEPPTPAASATSTPASAPKATPAPTEPVALTPTDAELEASFASQVVHGRSLLAAYHHPRTHSIPLALLHFRSHHLPLLNLFLHFTSHAASALGVPITRPASLPTQRRLWTVIKGPFVHKKAQENFERKTHKRVVKVYDADQEVVDRLVRYLGRHELAGVGMRVVRWHRAPVGVGRKTVEVMAREVRSVGGAAQAVEAQTSAEKVKKLGEQIIREEAAAATKSTAKEIVI